MIPKEFHGENDAFFLMPGLYVGFRPWSKALPPRSAMSRHLFWERKGRTSQAGNPLRGTCKNVFPRTHDLQMFRFMIIFA